MIDAPPAQLLGLIILKELPKLGMIAEWLLISPLQGGMERQGCFHPCDPVRIGGVISGCRQHPFQGQGKGAVRPGQFIDFGPPGPPFF